MEEANKKVQSPELDEYEVVKEHDPAEKVLLKRKKILKTAGYILGGLILLLILAFLFRDVLIENSIRHIGSIVTGTEVKIDSFRTSLSGTVELKNIKVANPAGYQKPYAVEVDRVYVKLLPATLTSQEPVVELVEVAGVRIDMELKGAGRSNLTDIQGNVEKFAGGSASSQKKDAGKAADPNAPSPLIKKIELTSMKISFSSSTLNSSLPVPLAPIYLSNIGGKGKPLGQTLLEITSAVMGAVNAVGGTVMSGVDAIGTAGKKSVDAIGTAGKKSVDAIGTAGKSSVDAISNAGKSIGSGVSGLFKKIK